MGKKTRILEDVAAALEKMQQPETVDIAVSTAQSVVVVVIAGALVVIAGALVELVILFRDPDESVIAEAFEGHGRDTMNYSR